MKGLRTDPPVTTLLRSWVSPLAPCGVTAHQRINPIPDGLAQPPGPIALINAEPRVLSVGCWMLDAGRWMLMPGCWLTACLGQVILVGSWDADLFCFCRCTIQSCASRLLKQKPHCAPLGFCSLPYGAPPFPLPTPPLSPCFLGPILRAPVLLPGLPLRTQARDQLPFLCGPPHHPDIYSPYPRILYPDHPGVAPVHQGLAAARTPPIGVSWQPMPRCINPPPTAHPANL